MLWYEYLVHYAGSVIGLFTLVKIYNLLYSRKKLKIKHIIIILLISILFNINTLTNYSFSKIFIFYILYSISLRMIFKDEIKKVLISGALIYIVVTFIETICSLIVIFFPFQNIKEINSDPIFKFLISLLIMLISICSFYTKRVKNLVLRSINYLIHKDIIYILILLIIIVLFLSSITFKNALNYKSLAYSIINIIIFVILIITLIISIYNIIKKNKAEEKEEVLLNFIKKYEYLIDKDRINRHEILNNLLVLKSFKNKNTDDYNKLLNNLIKDYKSPDSIKIKNLYNLPSGLKGIIYYKLYDMEKEGINIQTNISPKIINILDKLEMKEYTKLCKIIGILIDNSIEATKNFNNGKKEMNIDIYETKEEIIIDILNTADTSNIDINRINEKRYSSKGKNRGYGLFLVNKMINSSKKIHLFQKIIGNTFLTTLKIKKD